MGIYTQLGCFSFIHSYEEVPLLLFIKSPSKHAALINFRAKKPIISLVFQIGLW